MVATMNRMGRPKKAEPSEQVRMPRSVARRVRRLATHLGVDPGDYIAMRLAAALDRDEKKMVEEIEKDQEQQKGGGEK